MTRLCNVLVGFRLNEHLGHICLVLFAGKVNFHVTAGAAMDLANITGQASFALLRPRLHVMQNKVSFNCEGFKLVTSLKHSIFIS